MSTAAASSSPSLLDSFKKPIPTRPLKRNAACHQCRKRKLKCDAKRPCATCLRSHAYLLDHPPAGQTIPPYPDCTYDEVAPYEDEEDNERGEGYTKLESRISELESLLRDMNVELQAARAGSGSMDNSSRQTSPGNNDFPPSDGMSQTYFSDDVPMPSTSTGASASSFFPEATSVEIDTQLLMDSSALMNDFDISHLPPIFSQNQQFDGSMGDTRIMDFDTRPPQSTSSHYYPSTLLDLPDLALDFTGSIDVLQTPTQASFDVVPTSWSPHLPSLKVTRHLIQAFFAFHIHAGRLFHGPSFLASLDLHPGDHRFPPVGVLHALCAVGSLYTAEIEPTPIHTGSGFPYEVFHGRWRKIAKRADSFAEQHSKLAKVSLASFLEAGEYLLEGLQVNILLAWFYLCQAKFSDAYLTTGNALRYCVPLGLNIIPPFGQPPGPSGKAISGMSGPIIQQSIILHPAQTIIEDELRRNIFWLAYVLERQQSSGNHFALEMDDTDICQLLPVRGDQFDLGTAVPMEQRQWSHDRNVLLTHPPKQTDSFVLYVKASMVLSKVKTFHVRFKGRYYAGDAAMYSPSNSPTMSMEQLDPRDTPAFQELDHLVLSFKSSFPPHLRTPVDEVVVDPHLYSACVTAHLSIILLHDPFIQIENPHCPSGNRCIRAARAIIEYMHLITSTSYDVSLFDQLPIMGWYITGRTFVRFLEAAIRNNLVDHIAALQTDVNFVYTVLYKAGQRMPVAYRWRRVLYDVIAATCGEEYTNPLPTGTHYENVYLAPPVTFQSNPPASENANANAYSRASSAALPTSMPPGGSRSSMSDHGHATMASIPSNYAYPNMN